MGNKISYASSRRGHAAAMKHSAWSRTPGRISYQGATRSRDTQCAPHPMRTRRHVMTSLHSSNPTIRAAAKGLAIRAGLVPAPTAKHGWRRPKPVYPIAAPFVTGTRRTREG